MSNGPGADRPQGEVLLETAQAWRQEALEAVTTDEIRQELGIGRAARLERLAAGAGIVIVGEDYEEDSRLSVPSRNNLQIVPLAHTPGPGSTMEVTRPSKRRGSARSIKRIFQLDAMFYPTFDGVHVAGGDSSNFIFLDVGDGTESIPKGAPGALLLHFCAHEDQVRRQRKSDDPAEVVQGEAEALGVQFTVLDHYWGGRLSAVADLHANRMRRPDVPVYVPNEDNELFEAIHDSQRQLGFVRAINAAVIHSRYRYDPYGTELPSRGMVSAYEAWKLPFDTFFPNNP